LVSHVLLSPDLIRDVLVRVVQVEFAMAGAPGHCFINGRDRAINLAPESADQRVSRPPRLTQQWAQLLGRPIEHVWWSWFPGLPDEHVRQAVPGLMRWTGWSGGQARGPTHPGPAPGASRTGTIAARWTSAQCWSAISAQIEAACVHMGSPMSAAFRAMIIL
jgi:hypothetical protein